jgi:PAS domain S-box-containing protein
MKINRQKSKDISYLEERIRYLEEVERFTLDALETAASLGDFQTSINKLRDPDLILRETIKRIRGIISFQASAIYLVEENSSDFLLTISDSARQNKFIQSEVENFIQEGVFAWALREKRPVIVCSSNRKKKIVLHVISTSTRVRGMFVGILTREGEPVPDISLSLLSIILLYSANALESFELYKTIREINTNLKRVDNYRLLFEAAPDGVEVLDARGNIIDCNETQEKLIGYTREQLTGTHTSEYFSERSRISYLKNSRLSDKGYQETEFELLSATGNTIPIIRKEKAIIDEDGNMIGAVIYNQDISARRKAEEEKNKLEARLQRAQKMEALGTLAGGVAHDLNNILSGLVSYPELLLIQVSDDSPLRKSLETIQRSGEKASAIVQDLLTLARRGIVHTQIINLNDIVRDHFRSPEHEKLNLFHPHLEFKMSLDDSLLNIMGSPVHLSKTVMNLISNAAEATVEKGIVRIITKNCYIDKPILGFDTVKEGEYAAIMISDTGIGISEDNVERIFEPFYSKKVMGRSGTGLGMAVVWGTVKDHNGYIDVQTIEGQGTSFTLYFPVTREDIVRDKPKLSIDDYRGKNESVLVVDDVEEQREIAFVMLTRLGYRVNVVSSGEEAVAFLKDNDMDLVVLDMIMDPGMDGLDTYKKILEFRPDQKAVITSGFSETERVREAQRLGAKRYIKKPYLLQTIGIAIRNELDGKAD